MKDAQSVAAALANLLLPDEELVAFAILALTSVSASLFLERAAALSFSSETLFEQEEKASMTSSSNFLHFEKAEVQALRPLAIFPTSEILQDLTASDTEE